MMRVNLRLMLMGVAAIAMATTAKAELFFSTGNPDGLIATASRPGTSSAFEIESADDFILSQETKINSATFTGLLTGTSPSIGEVRVEIYRVFPQDSNVARTSGPPAFSTSQVPTRLNSPADVAFDDRDTKPAPPRAPDLTFRTSLLSSSFTANSRVEVWRGWLRSIAR